MQANRRKWLLLGLAIGAPLLLFLCDLCRVHVALGLCVSRATLGETVQQTVRRLGEPTSRGEWSGSRGSGVCLTYRRPYAWEHVFAVGRALLNMRDARTGGYVWCSDLWYIDNSPNVGITFDSAGRLVEVTRHGFASNVHLVVKSSRSR